jgi:4,5-dihydroxyphthalate decarboxylase
LRGHLQEAHGIAPEEVDWTTERPNVFPMPDGAKVRIAIRPENTTLIELLVRGELDAVVHEQAHTFLAQQPSLRRLLPDHRVVETDYYRATGCFPAVHGLVIRREIVAEHPWVPESLIQAFAESKRMCLDLLHGGNTRISAAWTDDWLEEERTCLAPDLYPYGLDATRPEIERLIRYLHEQQLIPHPLAVEEVFAP